MSDIVLGGTVAPGGPFEQARQSDIKGGLHSVADLTARNALPDYFREDGMLAWVRSSTTMYQLVGGIDNSNWTVAAASAFEVSGEAQGDVFYFNGTVWTRLPAGTLGKALITGGTGANPSWGYPIDLSISSQAAGDIIYFNGTNWVRLASGTTGNTLSAGTSPSWSSINLAGGANYVTGILPTANQAAQTLTGDVTGTTAANVVTTITGSSGIVILSSSETDWNQSSGNSRIRSRHKTAQTTNATPGVIDSLVLTNGQSITAYGIIQGFNVATGDLFWAEYKVAYERHGGTTTVKVAPALTVSHVSVAGYSTAFQLNGDNVTIEFVVTGVAATTINWQSEIRWSVRT